MPRLKRTKAAPKEPTKFTKATAEKLGWVFTHSASPKVTAEFETQGIVRSEPASFTAERYVARLGLTDKLVTEQAESMELLLERIRLFEAERASRELS